MPASSCRPSRLPSAYRQRALPGDAPAVGSGGHRLAARASSLAFAVAVAVVAAAATSPASAALFGDDEARKAIIDLRARVDAMQQDLVRRLEQVSQRQGDLEARIARLEQGQRVNLEQQNQIELLRQEVARLRGQVEEQLNALDQTRRQQKELTSQLDSRLKQFEPVQVTIDGKNVSVEQSEKRAYDAALEQFRASDFKAATASFQAFQKSWPESAYAPLAAYWEGGARYASGDFKGAIATMRALAQRHPDNPRVPDGLLILGNAQADAGDRKAARETFKSIVDRYPDTSAAGGARERLAAIK
ncbi:MAG: tol-pal system protein YbgF [Lautropia sp.]